MKLYSKPESLYGRPFIAQYAEWLEEFETANLLIELKITVRYTYWPFTKATATDPGNAAEVEVEELIIEGCSPEQCENAWLHGDLTAIGNDIIEAIHEAGKKAEELNYEEAS